MEYSYKIVDDLMLNFKLVIGADYERYRNHACRVFLNCILLDMKNGNEEKYAIASVFHDIGIWTSQTIDYLDPSIEQVNVYLTEIGKSEWIEELGLMIYWHHKVTGYEGAFKETVTNFRKADWIDVSLGLLTFGGDKKTIRENRKKLPNLNFHMFLVKEIFQNFLKHPFNPLPMFKK